MTVRQNTNNLVPSNNMKDLNDNTIILDEWVNSENDYTQDRFGNTFETRKKVLADLSSTVKEIKEGTGFLPISGGELSGNLNVQGKLLQENVDVLTKNGGEISGDINIIRNMTISGNTNVNGNLKQNGVNVFTEDGGVVTRRTNFTDKLQQNSHDVLTSESFPQQLLYPNGTPEAPDQLVVNNRVSIPNPLGDLSNTRVQVEILVNGQWGTYNNVVRSIAEGTGSSRGIGIKIELVESDIVIQTGTSGLLQPSAVDGNPFGLTVAINTVPYRVRVFKV
ncbi:hypothetical protein [Zophobihabitans entericus]|uniref:Uncharacterized protein n=1 Tax=Zophobihabitans entericus TaxID=1635327 RepID=A0A6G9IDJ3_9GAMM|nr:hypothetical protein [Zophobihabitans entericus]QIQ21774.1 hypothetical protein IPMB12_08810 [Zophobihabitans entericus]